MRKLLLVFTLLIVLGSACNLTGPRYSVRCPASGGEQWAVTDITITGEKGVPTYDFPSSTMSGMTLFPPTLSVNVHETITYPNGHVYNVDGTAVLSTGMMLQVSVIVSCKH